MEAMLTPRGVRRAGRAALLALAALAALPAGPSRAAPPLPADGPPRVENAWVRVEADPANGSILRILDREGGVDLAADPALADSFRLLLRLPGGRRLWVRGRAQALSAAEPREGGIALLWNGPLRDEAGGAHAIAARMGVRLRGRSVRFDFALDNRSRAVVEEVWYPVLGGFSRFGPPDDGAAPSARERAVIDTPPWNQPLTMPFGELTPLYPGQLQMGFVSVTNPAIGRGLYIGSHDVTPRLKAFRFAEARDGDAADIVAQLVHFPFTRPGARFSASPLVLRFHAGGWREAGGVYRDWFVRTFGLADPRRDWIRRQGFFVMTMFMLPEGNVNFRFRDIARWARAARDYGVRAVQIAGWQRGGHDNGYPLYTPDPRLGTWKELEEGIRACHRMGVRVYFFVNIQPAMLDIAWYRRELEGYAAVSRRGDPYWIAGWGMGTLASRMGLTTPQMAFLDPAFPAFRRALVRDFRRLAEVGADGIHIDKMFPALLDMNPRAPLGPDRSTWQGALDTIGDIARACRAVRPDFAISNECNWDRVLTYGAATWWAGNMSSARAVFPEVVETVGHYQPWDYVGLNNAVRLGHAVMLAPHQFNCDMGCETWRTGMSPYVRELKRIRDRLAEVVFFGEPRERGEARFEGLPKDSALDFAVYRGPRSGRRACIVTNGASAPRTVTFVGFDGAPRGRVRVHRPFEPPVDAALPARLRLPAEGIAFIVEVGP